MNALAAFALLTIKSPRDAAMQILARDWPREALWTAFLLSVVLNTCVYTLQQVLFPLPPEVLLPRFAPGAYFAVVLVLQLSFIAMLATTGRWLGGQGDLPSLLALITWLQLLQAALNGAIVVVFLILPAAGGAAQHCRQYRCVLYPLAFRQRGAQVRLRLALAWGGFDGQPDPGVCSTLHRGSDRPSQSGTARKCMTSKNPCRLPDPLA